VRVLRSPAAVQRWATHQRESGHTIGLVPTMGALHEGHLSLVRAARHACNQVVATIFVNPTQFGPTEDFARYPRTTRRDLALLRHEECDVVFMPAGDQMYPAGFQTYVVTGDLATDLEGRDRPTHFRGVTTICLKLFTICKPHRAYFGQKDYQQALVVQRMVADLNLDLVLKICPTVRESDGLAASSRNRHLGPADRERALAISRVLFEQAQALRNGLYTARAAERRGRQALSKAVGLRLDYFSVRQAHSLARPGPSDRDLVLLAAARVGRTRLIDNVRVRLNSGR